MEVIITNVIRVRDFYLNLVTSPGYLFALLGTPVAEAAENWAFDLGHVARPWGKTLAAHGVHLEGGYVGDLFRNVQGGLKRGGYHAQQLTAGLALDLDRAAGIAGAQFRLQVVTRSSPGLYAAYTGSSVAAPDNAGPVNATRLSELSWSQSLLDARLNLSAGRIVPGLDFAFSDLYCQFASAVCNPLAPWKWPFNSAAAGWPLPSWGGRATLRPSDATYLRVGAYAADPENYRTSGWPGSGWKINQGTGLFLPVEIGWRAAPGLDRRAVSAGLFHDATPYRDGYDTVGRPLGVAAGTPRVLRGRNAAYLQAEATIWRPAGESRRGIDLFGAAFAGLKGRSGESFFLLAGAIWTGPWPGRPRDALGLSLTGNWFDPSLRRAANETIAAHGGRGTMTGREWTFEINYGVAVAPGVTVKPFVQYVRFPDQMSSRIPDPAVRGSATVGMQLSIGFNDALGLPALRREN